MPGPNCKHKITCAICGRTQHNKDQGKHKNQWHMKCLDDGWVSPKTFTNRNHAMRMFRLHKHDADEALSEPMQQALTNLRNANLL